MRIEIVTDTEAIIASNEYGTRSYLNSTRQRNLLAAECPQEVVYQVLTIWGAEPTVTEPEYIAQAPIPDPMDQLRVDVDYLLIAEMQREGLL